MKESAGAVRSPASLLLMKLFGCGLLVPLTTPNGSESNQPVRVEGVVVNAVDMTVRNLKRTVRLAPVLPARSMSR
jgi:hypothetical protein